MVKGHGTSLITLIIPQGGQVARVSQKLVEEYGTAAHIKSRVNRQFVQAAIESAQQKLKLYSRIPPNGLVLFTGIIFTDDGKEKKVSIDFEPLKPLHHSVYLCDNRFHTEYLAETLQDGEESFGFIILDGNGCLMAMVQGSNKTILSQFTVDLPKKHGRGGQSALRFARLRLEKRHNYLRKCAEQATQHFISSTDHKCLVKGLIVAGSAELKQELLDSKLFDPRLQKAVMKVLDITYGMESGLNQAIEMSVEVLGQVKLIQEKQLLQTYFEEIAKDSGKFCFQVKETLQALEMGAVETLILWENLPLQRFVMKTSTTGEEQVVYLSAADEQQEEGNDHHLLDPVTGQRSEVVECQSLVEWLVEQYPRFGAKLSLVSDRSPEGCQFARGFGGIGGLLRWPVDFLHLEEGAQEGWDLLEAEEEDDDLETFSK